MYYKVLGVTDSNLITEPDKVTHKAKLRDLQVQ